jgi:tripartite-type tricarboxylate transporter receptor subunit TctC
MRRREFITLLGGALTSRSIPANAADVWTAFFLPKGTPSTIVQRLARGTSDALDTPAVRQHFADLGLRVARPEERMPEYLVKLVPAEIAKWAGPIKTSGVSMD